MGYLKIGLDLEKMANLTTWFTAIDHIFEQS